MTVMHLPAGIRQYYRTSNHIERINRELKRRSNVIGVFPNEASLVRLTGSVLLKIDDAYAGEYVEFGKPTYQKLLSSDLRNDFETIAENQKGMLAA